MSCNICTTDILKHIWNWPWYSFSSSLTVPSKLFPVYRVFLLKIRVEAGVQSLDLNISHLKISYFHVIYSLGL